MPRLSLYRSNRQNDYKFLDRTISEMYQVGGLDIYVHKYLGPIVHPVDPPSDTGGTADATQPAYTQQNPLFIEDLFLLENRDRKYDQDVYIMRGVYNQQDIDFDLTQFGLFLNNDTLFITFHYNNMIETIGRKLMPGDVLELPNLKDYHPLDGGIAKALPKYYVIQDGSYASEGMSQTWMPHTWRVKATPMVASQEFNDILNKPFATDNIFDPGNFYPNGSTVLDGTAYYRAIQDVPVGTPVTDTAYWQPYTPPTIQDIQGTRSKELEINDAILTQAEFEVPLSGYDNTKFYIVPTANGGPSSLHSFTSDTTAFTADVGVNNSVTDVSTPETEGYVHGYLTGGQIAPNGLPVVPGISFPADPKAGDYSLRLDYHPNRLFRYDGKRWVKMEDNVRTNLTPGPTNHTLRSNFVNDTSTVHTADRGVIPARQSLSKLLKPQADD
jgi:hypothetical protein